jgi:hypothetical protein
MRRFWGLSLFLCLSVTACAAPKTVALSGYTGGESPYPASFRAQHRVTLTAAGRQVDFTGYLLVQQSTWRAMAFNEFGVTLFDMTASPEKGRRVIRTSGIPVSYLTRQAADIIEVLFLCPQEPEAVFSEGRFRVLRDGAVYDIAYSDYTAFPGVKHKIPGHMVLENKKAGLRLEADLLKFEPGKIPEKYFHE